MRIDKSLVEEARKRDMILFLEGHCGYSFKPQSGGYRCWQHPSLVVKGDRLSWYWHSKGMGGYGALDYLMKVENLTFHQAMESAARLPAAPSVNEESEAKKALALPEKARPPQGRLLNYLCHRRGIDRSIVFSLLNQEKIYQDRNGNVVFVGFDETGKPRFASLRGTNATGQFRRDCAGSDKRYGFHITHSPSQRLYIFESPIDAMSHATLENLITSDKDAWRRDNRLSLAGTSDTALPIYLASHPHIEELILCLDSDTAGREASVAIARKYGAKGYLTRIELPQHKDYNDDLLAKIAALDVKTSKGVER